VDSSTSTLVFVAIAIVVLCAVISALKRQRQKQLIFAQAREFAATIQQTRSLPTVATDILLKPGESAFLFIASTLYETRSVRHYQATRTGFRVAKGVWVGGTSGRSVSNQEWAKVDTGSLTITNKRLVFHGQQADRTAALDKIVSVNSSVSQLHVSVEGRQKTMVFDAPNPLIAEAVVRVCSQFSNPLALPAGNIKFTFQELKA
jgi:hypothetical protein